MGRFDEFVDEFVFMAKNAADVAGKKTGEVVELGKLRYQVKQAEWDVERTYTKLGALVYESKRGGENLDDAIKLVLDEIDEIKLRIERLEESVRAYKKVKKCPKCEKENMLDALFCTRCGMALDENDETTATEPAEEPIDF